MRTFLFLTVTFCTAAFLSAAEPLVLSKDGKTEYVIVLSAEPTAVEQTAAKELKEHLDAVTGADFAIVKETEVNVAKPQLVVGNSKRFKELLPDLDLAKIPYDGIVIKSVGKNVVLAGHPQRGTLYAVNTFLEDAVGIRWWTSTESSIPKKPTLEIPEQNIEYAPKLIYRHSHFRDVYAHVNPNNNCPVFATRMKCNGEWLAIPPEYGGHHRYFHFVHSFFLLLPPNKYFADHPEWYSEINGKRQYEGAQLCLTNDEMRAELTKNALEGLRKNPDARFISISQEDWQGYCTCAKCKAIDDEEGSHAGTLLRFINKVAEDIEKEFPDVWVDTLAYQYTRKPPKSVKPRKNVVIRLCTIECSFVQPLGEGEQNKALREDMQGWSKIADNLFVWDYTVNFSSYMLPHPNHRVLASNVRFFVENNTIGLYEQGDAHCAAGDFARLKNWVLSKLMWNPSLDENKLFDEFLNGYYGAEAGPIVKEYLTLIHNRAEKSGVYLGIYRTGTEWLDLETFLKAHTLMEKAVAAAKEETIRNRLRRDKMPIDLVMLKDYYTLRRKADWAGRSITLPENPKLLLDDFAARCQEFGVSRYDEGGGAAKLKSVLDSLQQRFDYGMPPCPNFCKDIPPDSWYEVQDFEFSHHRLGEWSFQVDDEKASDKRAVKMPGNFGLRPVYWNLINGVVLIPAGEAKEKPEYRFYAAVRCDAKEGIEGTAMTIGVNSGGNPSLVNKAVSVADIRGAEYRWIDVGTLSSLDSFRDVWFGSPGRPGEVDAVYVDRIVVVRER